MNLQSKPSPVKALMRKKAHLPFKASMQARGFSFKPANMGGKHRAIAPNTTM
jgi:hypothetical protein